MGGFMKFVSLVLLSLLFCSMVSHAEMYRWEDERGVVTFKDTPPPASKKRKVKVYTEKDFDVAPPVPPVSKSSTKSQTSSSPTPVVAPKAERFNGTVEMYVTDWCPVCKKAEQYMSARNYPFVAYDIEKDKSAMKRYQEMGGRGVPLILLGSQKLSGFSSSAIDQYMQGHKSP
jgi:glutaredoxin